MTCADSAATALGRSRTDQGGSQPSLPGASLPRRNGRARALPSTITRRFPGDPSQVRQARDLARRFAAGHPAAEDIVLVTSELASNAILHTASGHPGGWFWVCMTRHDDGVAIQVTDQGGTTRPGAGLNGGERGRGLMLVEALASRWAAHDTGSGWQVLAVIAGHEEGPAMPELDSRGASGAALLGGARAPHGASGAA